MSVSDSTALRYQTSDPDVRLMLRVRDDDAAAFEQLVSQYQGRLMAIIANVVPRRDQAEDLVQEVFLRVYRNRKTYQAGAKFSTWLFTIANNVASNSRRTFARRREVHVAAQNSSEQSAKPMDELALEASGLMPTRQLDRSEMSEVVRLAIESLNERQRMALMLSKFEEMSYADIAEAMELSVPAVKSLLTRARENLRVLLEPYVREGIQP